MNELSITTDYTIRILLCIISFPPSRTAGQIDVQMGIPANQTGEVLEKLVSAGWVMRLESSADRYAMAREPRKIALLDVIRLTEEVAILNRCRADEAYCFLSRIEMKVQR